jgi:peptide/nickel transport system permease protein
MAVAALVVLIGYLIFCFVGPLIYHSNQLQSNIVNSDEAPSWQHLLGTDSLGFDELGRLMIGGRSSLEIGLAAALAATSFGSIWGAVAGYVGRGLDSVMMRIVDIMLSVPLLFVLLILATFVHGSVISMATIIAIFAWLTPARLIRAEVLSLRSRDYVTAARGSGASHRRIIARHLLPNAAGVVAVNSTFQVADAIIIQSLLGFLGLGLGYPNVDWGDMLSQGVNFLQDGYWWLIYPVAGSIALVVMSFNLLGDALRDALDVRLQR